MGKLSDKVAVVTDALKGIGAEIARELAAAGAAVVVNYASSRDGADKVVAEITRNGGSALAIQGDVAKAADVAHLFAETARVFGPIDILVNNAGIYQVRRDRNGIGRGIPSPFQHKRSWCASGDQGSTQTLRIRWRQHHQYRFGREPIDAAG
jgi:NAD(P)-dependent dehydrogenase (short-subunit alcohol dehydrogenase family)